MSKKDVVLTLGTAGLLTLVFLLTDTRVCLIWNLFHTPCPSCGATRATVLLIQGELEESIAYSPLPLILIIGFFAWLVFFRKHPERTQKYKWWLVAGAVVIVAGLWVKALKNPLLY